MTIKKTKKPVTSISKEVEKTAKKLQELVRLKAADSNGFVKCVMCGIVRQWNDQMHGSHYYERKVLRFKLYEENIHVCCSACNNFRMKERKWQNVYQQYMYEMYGKRRIKAMDRLAWRPPPKFERSDIIALRNEIKEQIKIQWQRIYGDNKCSV